MAGVSRCGRGRGVKGSKSITAHGAYGGHLRAGHMRGGGASNEARVRAVARFTSARTICSYLLHVPASVVSLAAK
jgi:hypothetical protein